MHRSAAAAGKRLRSLKNTFRTSSAAATHTLPLYDLAEEPKTLVTTLPNGLRIASEPSRHPVASIGLYIKCGPIYETGVSTGASRLLRNMSFKSTLNRSRDQLFKEAEATRGSLGIYYSHELTGYMFDAIKIYMPKMVELLVDAVRNPAYLDGEIMQEIHNIREEESSIGLQPYVMRLLHSVAFSGALAKPLSPPFSAISRLNSSILKNFVAENYTAPRIVLAASGVEHKELVSVATPLLLDLPMASLKEEPKSTYVGGEYRQHGVENATYVALAFEAPGGMSDRKMSITVAILEKLLGGCYILRSKDKGDRTPINLTEEGFLGSDSSFCQLYNHTGLFGCFLDAVPRRASILVDSAVEGFTALATPGKVCQEHLDIVIEAVKSEKSTRLETRTKVSQDIGQQILTYGERKPFSEFLKTVDSITLEGVTSAARKIISSPLTLVAFGDVTHVPSYASLSRRFGCS